VRSSTDLPSEPTSVRVHAARVWVQHVVADHQVIAVEDFKPAFLTRSTMVRKAPTRRSERLNEN
jgi:putative transposase